MRPALSTRTFPAEAGPAAVAETVRRLGLSLVHFAVAPAQPARFATVLVEFGVRVAGVESPGPPGAGDAAPGPFADALTRAEGAASVLKAEAVLVEGGHLPVREGHDLVRRDRLMAELARGTASVDSKEVLALRDQVRVAAADRAARVLHAAARRGVPIAIRNGAGVGDLLGFEETGWVLGEVARLALWFDPARARRLERLGAGPPAAEWADRYARRVGGVYLHGLAGNLDPHAHPEEGGIDWRTLRGSLPGTVPWVLDLSPSHGERDLSDALRQY
jgi:hypothetical protein